jgi:hypothetical protein
VIVRRENDAFGFFLTPISRSYHKYDLRNLCIALSWDSAHLFEVIECQEDHFAVAH